MDFDLSEEQRIALDGWRRFLERDVRPKIESLGEDLIPKPLAQELLGMTTQYGVGCGWVGEQDGGLGLDFVTSGLLYEELARVSPDLAGLAFVTEGAALKLQHSGTPELKARYMPGLLSGELIGCSAISEPGTGSDVRSMRTRAVRDGDDYILNGEKMWISNAAIADIVIAVARTGENEFTMFLVDREEHGFEVREIKKLGLNGWSLGQIIFADARVPAANLLGNVGAGLRESMRGFERSRCFISLLALGLCQAALDASIAYAKDRAQFGKPIAAHQMVQDLIAEMAMLLDASRLLVYRGLSLLDKGGHHNREAAIAKAFTTEAAVRITSHAIQVHGAFGISREFPVERYFRAARMLTIPDGTTQINRLVIGRDLLGVSAFT